MHFDEFLKYTPKIQNATLPATLAHAKMAPSNHMDLLNSIDFANLNPKQAAVLMLFYPKNEQTHLALIVRNTYNGVHSSQIAFPGGKVEKEDADFSATALRETQEEIGIDPNCIMLIRAFTQVYIPPSNFMVYPYLGYSKQDLVFTLQEEEVAGIVELPMTDFLDDRIIENKIMKTSYADAFEVPGFQVNQHFVWGATAMMLSELKETIKMVI